MFSVELAAGLFHWRGGRPVSLFLLHRRSREISLAERLDHERRPRRVPAAARDPVTRNTQQRNTQQLLAFGPGSTLPWVGITSEIRERVPTMLHHSPPRETYSINRKLRCAFLLGSRLRVTVDCKKLWDDVTWSNHTVKQESSSELYYHVYR